MQWLADAHADAAVAAILEGADPAERLRRIDALNGVLRSWQTNAQVRDWRADSTAIAPALAAPVEAYLTAAQPLPPWAEPDRIARAEQLFMDYGALSVTMLFCASLPECYVVPDLAAVLHATGQLEDRAEYRIRSTGAMVFPVMMHGGLTLPTGGGVAQILKVRLIHATVRNLILRESPEAAIARLHAANDATVQTIPPLGAVQPGDSMSQALSKVGWDLGARALPNNQEELAYTLLTFSYVYLRALRRLGIPLSDEHERDYLHAWNVAGWYLGIRRELMVDTMEDAADLFARMQARGRRDWAARPTPVDPRKGLATALMDAMKTVMPDGAFKAFPVLLARKLMEPASVADLGLDARVTWLARTCFAMLLGTARCIDGLVRVVFPDFSVSRLLTRAIGYRLMCTLLMSQTRELSVPSALRPAAQQLIRAWSDDPKASSRMNRLEDMVTTRGDWEALPPPARR